MRREDQIIAFLLDERRYALPLAAVQRVVRAVEITPLPKAPEIVSGVINVQGQIVPVVNIRRRFRLPECALMPGDQIIIARTSNRTVAFIADTANGVIECPAERFVTAAAIVPGLEYVKGVAKLEDGMILIHDLDSFLSLEEARSLDNAMVDP